MKDELALPMDTAGILLPQEPDPQLQPHPLHLHQQMDTLTRTISGLSLRIDQQLSPSSSPDIPRVSSTPELASPYRYAVPPERYGGDPEGCKKFVFACKLCFAELPEMTAPQKVSFIKRSQKGS